MNGFQMIYLSFTGWTDSGAQGRCLYREGEAKIVNDYLKYVSVLYCTRLLYRTKNICGIVMPQRSWSCPRVISIVMTYKKSLFRIRKRLSSLSYIHCLSASGVTSASTESCKKKLRDASISKVALLVYLRNEVRF